ncbi:MAG TPA: GNAT family N-acetyltransferase [Dongiaceae bacterium]|jgi:putative acetyltransferase|nr:GNAT family N-acetyltransferase [Dongiaceae bacterium]
MAIAIRLARDKDCAAIARLRRHTIRHVNSRDYSAEVIRGWAARVSAASLRASTDRCKRWVAFDLGRIVGFCEHTFDGELSRIYVHKDYLGKGLGSRLLGFAEASLRKLGCERIWLDATVTAKDFYLANGYEVVRKASYGGNKSEPIYKMRKSFSSR